MSISEAYGIYNKKRNEEIDKKNWKKMMSSLKNWKDEDWKTMISSLKNWRDHKSVKYFYKMFLNNTNTPEFYPKFTSEFKIHMCQAYIIMNLYHNVKLEKLINKFYDNESLYLPSIYLPENKKTLILVRKELDRKKIIMDELKSKLETGLIHDISSFYKYMILKPGKYYKEIMDIMAW